MELYQLKYFLSAARHENLSKAAKEEFVSQSAISRAINALETELMTPLFERNGNRIHLTTAGNMLFIQASGAVSTLKKVKEELSSFQNSFMQVVHIKMTSGYGMFPEHIRMFSELHPDVGFHVLPPDSDSPCDIVIDTARQEAIPEDAVVLQREYLKLIVPVSHPLAGAGWVDIRSLGRTPFIAVELGDPLRKVSDELCEAADFHPNISYVCFNADIMQTLIRAGIGAALWPASSVKNVLSAKTAALDINSVQEGELTIARPEDHFISEYAREFLDFIKSLSSEQGAVCSAASSAAGSDCPHEET